MKENRNLRDFLHQSTKLLGYTKPRPFLEQAATNMRDSKIIVVEAPTGYGKTTLSIAFTMNATLGDGLKAIVAYPLRSLLEQQLSKFKSVYTALGFNGKFAGARYMGHAESPYLTKPVSLTTIDTLSLTALGLPPEDIDKAIKFGLGFSHHSMGHYLFSRAMFSLSWLVLDEVHLLTDSTKSLSFLIALLRLASINDQKVLMLSATVPRAMMEILEKEVEIKFIRFRGNYADKEFLAERRRKKYHVHIEALNDDWREHIYLWLRDGLEKWKRAIVVFNSVERAVAFYEKTLSSNGKLKVDKGDILLLHSRFTESDRKSKMSQLEKNEWKVLIATQVIEAGVDISSDLFITELAPANSLVQRLGRFLRREGENEGEIYIWYDKGTMKKADKSGKYTVYDADLVRETLSALESRTEINFHDPYSYQTILDEVYTKDNYIINQNYIAEVNIAYFQLNRIKYVVNLFLEKVEGSFVRENTMAPVIAGKTDVKKLGEITNATIPLGLDLIHKHLIGYFHVDGEKHVVFEEVNSSKMKSRDLLKMSLNPNFLAFVVNGIYDEKKGLLLA